MCPLDVGFHNNVGVVEVPASGVTSLKVVIEWQTGTGAQVRTRYWD